VLKGYGKFVTSNWSFRIQASTFKLSPICSLKMNFEKHKQKKKPKQVGILKNVELLIKPINYGTQVGDEICVPI